MRQPPVRTQSAAHHPNRPSPAHPKEYTVTDIVPAIRSALNSTGTIVRAIPDHSWHLPTPCTDWTVRDVTNHLVGGLCIFTDELNGVPARAEHHSHWLNDDPAAAYAYASEHDGRAWGRPDALTGTITIGLGTLPAPLAAVIHLTEVLVHGADIAVAIGREDLLDQDSCTALLQTMKDMGGVDPYRTPGVFGPAVTVAADQPGHRQLLAYLGRALTPQGRDRVA
jgi:uncharacterized protein (TIGR03086 family)